MDSRTRMLLAAAMVLAVAMTTGATGCAETPTASLGEKVGAPTYPPPPDLTTPEGAVKGYIERVSLAYRLANSLATTSVITQFEEVRIDAYIQLNKEKNQGIDQSLTRFDLKRVRIAEPTATVSGREEWRYRYFDLTSLLYKGPEQAASYDVTYTVVHEPRGWVVDSVEATSPTLPK